MVPAGTTITGWVVFGAVPGIMSGSGNINGNPVTIPGGSIVHDQCECTEQPDGRLSEYSHGNGAQWGDRPDAGATTAPRIRTRKRQF